MDEKLQCPRNAMEGEREVAEACAHQVAGIEVKNVTPFGRLVYGYGRLGQANRDACLACYQARVDREVHALVAPGYLSSSAGVGAHTTVPVTLLGDTVLVPVTLNHTRQGALMMDLGTSHTILSPAVLARLGVSVPSMPVTGPSPSKGASRSRCPWSGCRLSLSAPWRWRTLMSGSPLPSRVCPGLTGC